jgi:hypothetical protein
VRGVFVGLFYHHGRLVSTIGDGMN